MASFSPRFESLFNANKRLKIALDRVLLRESVPAELVDRSAIIPKDHPAWSDLESHLPALKNTPYHQHLTKALQTKDTSHLVDNIPIMQIDREARNASDVASANALHALRHVVAHKEPPVKRWYDVGGLVATRAYNAEHAMKLAELRYGITMPSHVRELEV